MSKWRKPRVYQGVGTGIKKTNNTDENSRWVCPHCGAGVKRNKSGAAQAHAAGGGRVRTGIGIPCLGGMAKIRPGLKVRPPKLSAPDGNVDA